MTRSMRGCGLPCGSTLSRRALAILLCAPLLAAEPAIAANDDNFFTHLHTEKAMANVTIAPARTGDVDITIQLETSDERPLVARAVSVTLSNAQSKGGAQTVEASRASDGQWHVRTSIKVPGRWMLGLRISISDTDKVNIESPILIAASSAAGTAGSPDADTTAADHSHHQHDADHSGKKK